jgi:fructuronate reductase
VTAPAVRPLSRARDGRPAAPVRHVHLGLGNFFRAHQAWYTEHAPDAADWGIAAFTGRSTALASALAAQDGLYTLGTRAADDDHFAVISSVSAAHPGADHASWLGYLASPDVQVVTLTVTEAGYLRGSDGGGDGGLDTGHPAVQADLTALRSDPAAPVRTVPGRLAAGLAARRRAGAGPLTVVPCDNLPGNGPAAHRVLTDFAVLLDPSLEQWITESVRFVTTVADRITPRLTAQDPAVVQARTGISDRAPVVTEPFSEWVLSGSFAAGRPAWHEAGATFTDHIGPFEQRKLWLLNGGHCLLAYAGALRGHRTVAGAIADQVCRGWLQQWWDEAAQHLNLPAGSIAAYQAALAGRFGNPRIRYLLAQVATDGSVKLPVRILPVLRAERTAGRLPPGAIRVLAAWVCHLRGLGAPISDPRAAELTAQAAGPLTGAVRAVLACLDPALGADQDLIAATEAQINELSPAASRALPRH